jgi:plastocyanin
MVSIGHPSSLNVVTMLVIVEEIPENLAVYIVSSDSLLVEMSTSESQRRITAHLTGASPQDDFGLQWTISNYNSLVKNPDGQSFNVISIIANGDTCFIQPVRVTGYGVIEGEAIITVKHPKTSHRLDFKVIVMDQTEIKFQESYITMTQGETQTVKVQSPANRIIRYSSSDKSVVDVDGTNTMCILKAKAEGAAIISAYDIGGTKSDEIIVKVNGITYDRPYINAQTLVLLSRQQPQGTTIKAELRNARDDSLLPNTYNQNLYWSVDNAGIVTFFGGRKNPTYPAEYRDLPFGPEIGVQPGNIGDAVITVKYFHNHADNYAGCDCYRQYPELKNAEAKIYARVNTSGTSVIIDPSVFNLEWGQPSGRIVTARVTGESGVNYGIGGNIRWESDDETIAKVEQREGNNNESVALVVPYSAFDSENSNTGPVTIRAIYVKNNAQADYGTATALVSPRRLLAFSMGSINIIPGDEITFTSNDPTYKITCYPENEELTVSASSNAFFSFTYKEQLEDNGKMGRELSIRGTQAEGSGSIILTGKTNGLTAQLLVNNVLNQNIQWQNGKTVYLEPKQSTTKLFLLTPERYSLRFKTQKGNNSIAVQKIGDTEPRDSAGNSKSDAELIFTEMENTGHATFNRGYEITSHPQNGKSGKYNPIFAIMDGQSDAGMGEVELEVIVGYKDVAIDFSGESINNPGGNKTSFFDKTQSSIRLAGNMGYASDINDCLNGLEFTIIAKSGNNTDTNVTIDYDETKFVLDTAKNDYLRKELKDNNKIRLYYVTNVQEPNTGPSGTLYRSDYIGVLTIKYTYNTYTKEDVPGEKNFLVYHDRYYR